MKRLLATLLVAATMAMTGTVGAQAPKVGDKFGDWNFNCRAVGQDTTVCGLYQIVLWETESGKSPIMNLTIRRFDDTKTKTRRTVLAALMPLGIFLPAGVAARIDKGEQFALVPQTCSKNGCEAAVVLNDKTLATLKAGKELFVGFQVGLGGKVVTVSVSLAGITKGLTALK